jgi:hypothetical protein
MIKIKTFQLPKEENKANEFLGTQAVLGLHYDGGNCIIRYEDGEVMPDKLQKRITLGVKLNEAYGKYWGLEVQCTMYKATVNRLAYPGYSPDSDQKTKKFKYQEMGLKPAEAEDAIRRLQEIDAQLMSSEVAKFQVEQEIKSLQELFDELK